MHCRLIHLVLLPCYLLSECAVKHCSVQDDQGKCKKSASFSRKNKEKQVLSYPYPTSLSYSTPNPSPEIVSKYRITFFVGGEKRSSGSCKTSDFFDGKYGYFALKVLMFPSKKSDILIFRFFRARHMKYPVILGAFSLTTTDC